MAGRAAVDHLMDAGDWLAPTDALLCARWTACTLCGARRLVWADLYTIGALAVVVTLCAACRHRDPQRQAVERLLTERYGGRTV
jgi:hypothetical protein